MASGAGWLPLAVALAAAAGCATPRGPTVLVRGFLGADAQGGFAVAEVDRWPERKGAEAARRALIRHVGPDGRSAGEQPLDAAAAERALDEAVRAEGRTDRTAERGLARVAVPGFGWEGVVELGPMGGRVEPAPGRAALLERVDTPAEIRLALKMEGAEDRPLLALPRSGTTTAVSSILILPGGRRGLALTVAASGTGDRLYRVEAISELEIGRAAGIQLGERAIRELVAGRPEAARGDLLLAVQASPRDAIAHYNLACANALTGRADEALLALGTAVELAPELKGHALRDPDLEALHERVEFRLMLEPRGGFGP